MSSDTRRVSSDSHASLTNRIHGGHGGTLKAQKKRKSAKLCPYLTRRVFPLSREFWAFQESHRVMNEQICGRHAQAWAGGIGNQMLLPYNNITFIALFNILQTQSTVPKNTKLAISRISKDDETRLLQYETPNNPFVVLRPNEQHVRDGGVGDPRFRPRQCIGAVFALLRSGPHAAGIGTRTRFGQTEASN